MRLTRDAAFFLLEVLPLFWVRSLGISPCVYLSSTNPLEYISNIAYYSAEYGEKIELV